jgi:hypothetical protein
VLSAAWAADPEREQERLLKAAREATLYKDSVMSGLKVASYADREAARHREEARDLSEIARQTQRLERLSEVLANLSVPPASSLRSIRQRMENTTPSLTATERRDFIARLNADVEKVEAAIRDARIERQRLVLTARSLLGGADGEARAVLEAAVRGGQSAGPEAFKTLRQGVEGFVTQRILRAGAEPARKDVSPAARQLAEALMSSHAPCAELPKEAEATRSKVDKLLELLGEFGEEGGVLRDRAERLFETPASADFQLKLDSLSLDAAVLREARIQRIEAERKIEAAIDRLAPFDDPGSATLKARLSEALTGTVQQSQSLAEKAVEHAQLMAQQEDARKARAAMLSGLVALGYEVHIDGVSWDDGERITVSRPEEPNYDVQLAARADGKVQAKVRAFRHSGRSDAINRRDAEVEDQWCSDLRSLHSQMASQGLAATLERAEAPRALPVVLVDHPGKRQSSVAPGGTIRQRMK